MNERRLERGFAPSSSEGLAKEEKLRWFREEWTWLHRLEEDSVQDLCDADAEKQERNPNKSVLCRRWWMVANSMLWMFNRVQDQQGEVLNPFPTMPLGRIANVCEELGNGNIPDAISDASKAGRQMWRAERHHIAYAVFYLEAVAKGDIEDKSPNKTVRQIYNVTSEAVRGWQRPRDEICAGVPAHHINPL